MAEEQNEHHPVHAKNSDGSVQQKKVIAGALHWLGKLVTGDNTIVNLGQVDSPSHDTDVKQALANLKPGQSLLWFVRE